MRKLSDYYSWPVRVQSREPSIILKNAFKLHPVRPWCKLFLVLKVWTHSTQIFPAVWLIFHRLRVTFTANSKRQFVPHVTIFSYICRLLFIIVTNKIVVSGQLHASMRVTVNPLLSPPGRLFISSRFEGRLNRDRGRAYLIETRRSIGGKVQVQEDLGHAAEDQNQIRTSSW